MNNKCVKRAICYFRLANESKETYKDIYTKIDTAISNFKKIYKIKGLKLNYDK